MKKNIFTFIIVYIITNSLLFPRVAVEASGNGIVTWFYQILPALLPFTIISGIFLRSQILNSFRLKTSLIPICIILFCGTIFGFPIGAKLSGDFYTQGYLRKSQAEILCICTNNFSPMYVNGFVIPSLFQINTIIFPILFLLYAVPVIIGVILLVFTAKEETIQIKSASRFQLDMQIIDAGIISGFETLIKICGYIVLFSLITSFCMQFVKTLSVTGVLLLGNFEITSGIKLLSECKISNFIKYIISIQFLSFGGISGLAQSASFLTPAGLSIKKYIIGKVILSVILTTLAILLYGTTNIN